MRVESKKKGRMSYQYNERNYMLIKTRTEDSIK